jgi:drug/metabolite transporter (DMT)-like permease
MGIFGKEAYEAGVNVPSLVAIRFVIASSIFWAIIAVRGRRSGARPGPAPVAAGLILGAAGYALQAGLYFGAVGKIGAGLTSLLLYTYPAIVFALALVLGREHPTRARLGALALATGGAALVLLGGDTGGVEGVGIAMGLGAALTYSAYILFADRVTTGADPFVLSAVIATGAAASLTTFSLVTGQLDLTFETRGWLLILAVALFSTVLAVSCFLVGLRLVGPATASIVSTIEPVVTVGLAMALFGEQLGTVQFAGGALVLAAVVLLHTRGRVAPPEVPAAAAAGTAAPSAARG